MNNRDKVRNEGRVEVRCEVVSRYGSPCVKPKGHAGEHAASAPSEQTGTGEWLKCPVCKYERGFYRQNVWETAIRIKCMECGEWATRENWGLNPLAPPAFPLQGEVDAEHELRNLLAIIHRDGGHKTDELGLAESVKLAHKVWSELVRGAEAASPPLELKADCPKCGEGGLLFDLRDRHVYCLADCNWEQEISGDIAVSVDDFAQFFRPSQHKGEGE